MVFMIEVRGSGRPGEYRLNRVNVVVFFWCLKEIVVTLNWATLDHGIRCRLLKGNTGEYVPLYIALGK